MLTLPVEKFAKDEKVILFLEKIKINQNQCEQHHSYSASQLPY